MKRVCFWLLWEAFWKLAAGQGLQYANTKTSPASALSGVDVLKQLPTRGGFGCLAACVRNPGCYGCEFDRAEKTCLLQGLGVVNLPDSPPYPGNKASAPVRRYRIQKRYCPPLPSPKQNALYTNWTSGKVSIGAKIGYKCKRGTAFHSQDLVTVGMAATGTASDRERFQTINITCQFPGTWSPAFAALPRCSEFVECKKTSKGKDYLGSFFNKSETGLPCLKWSTQNLDTTAALKDDDYFPGDDSVAGASNFCRNPLGLERPFCIVQGSPVRQFCNVPACEDPRPFECAWKPRGNDYMGSVSVTTAQVPCQAWNASDPHAPHPVYVTMLPDDSEAHNQCRNSDYYDPQPWCYTTDPGTRWDFCDVPSCPGFP